MYDECREWNRKNILNYIEIYLKVPVDVLIQRDSKKLYSKAIKSEIKNVMGIDMEYEEPKNPDIEIENYGLNTVEKVLKIIIDKFNL